MSLRSWTRRLFAPAATRPARKAPTRCRPALEALEDRTLLSGTPTSLYLSWGQGPLVYGKSVTFTAWILTPAGPVQPTAADGTVSFYDGATLLGTAAISGIDRSFWGAPEAFATLTTAALAAGRHTITARYSGDGSFAASASVAQPGSGQVSIWPKQSQPSGVAVDGSGDVFIADTGNNQVVKVTPSGTQTRIGSELFHPLGVAVDGSGDVFIADTGNNRVVKVTPSGTQTTVPSLLLSSPHGVAVDGSGDLFIADTGNNEVVKVTPSGTLTIVGFFSSPHGVAVDGSGDVFIAYNSAETGFGGVEKVTPSGTSTSVQVGLSQSSGVVAVDGSGDVFIADTGNHQVVEVDSFGFIIHIPTSGSPMGVAVDGSGDVFVADPLFGVSELTPGIQVTVNPDRTTLSVRSSANPALPGQPITFTAAVTANAPGSGTPTGTVQFQIDGTDFGPAVPLGGGSATSGPISTLALGTHVITAVYTPDTNYLGSVASGNFQVVGLLQGGFEAPGLGTGWSAYRYNPGGTAWTFNGTAGVAGNGSAFTAGNPAAPEGTQVAFLQETGSISQSVTLSAGTYTLSFSAAQRANVQASRQLFAVEVDGAVVATFAPNGINYATYHTGSFTLTAGVHTITFVGLDPDGRDNTAFIDQVQLSRLG